MRVPLAWLNLMHNKRRLLASLAGIVGAVLLMFVEVGFLNALLDSQVAVIRMLDADLVIVNRLKYTLSMTQPFPRRRVSQALAVDGVRTASPVYIEIDASLWKNPADGHTRVIRVLAFDPDRPVFRNSEIERGRPALKQADTAMFDLKSRPEYGEIRPGVRTELARRAVRVVGVFALGTDFANDGNVIMSDKSFVRFFPHRAGADGEPESVELGVLRLEAGADAAAVRRALRDTLPPDVAIVTPDELAATEAAYWEDSVPIGYVFGLGAAMGFVIGVMICYQILFTDVTDHLPQFATLKAIGYGNRYLIGVVIQEALLLSLLGFGPGIAISQLLYQWLAAMTGLPMQLTPERAGVVLALTVAMTVISGLIAVRKAVAADPAEVFG